jgi:uncharacterized protein YoxC
MNERVKIAFQVIALLVAGICGYAVSSFAVRDLNKRVLDTALQLGRIEKGIEGLDTQRSLLDEKMKQLETNLNPLAESIDIISKADLDKVKEIILSIQQSEDAQRLIRDKLKIATLDLRLQFGPQCEPNVICIDQSNDPLDHPLKTFGREVLAAWLVPIEDVRRFGGFDQLEVIKTPGKSNEISLRHRLINKQGDKDILGVRVWVLYI